MDSARLQPSLILIFLFATLASVPCAGAAITVQPDALVLCAGDKQPLALKGASSGAKATWSATAGTITGNGLSVTYTAPPVPSSVTITATVGAEQATANVAVSTSCNSVDNEARAVIGFEQAGASAASAAQHFFFDFFIDRQMKTRDLSLWGNVRIASYPQQIDTPVAQFATTFATTVGALKVNQLAETAEFSTGLDWHPIHWNSGTDATRRLGFIFSVGAKGPFQPTSRLSLFTVPDPASPQYSRFAAEFPSAAKSTYIGFVPPDRNRFYRSYGAGIRVTTLYHGSGNRSPATYTVLFGQDENVSGGSLVGIVGKIDVFYPLPIAKGKTRFLYLFGNADLRLSKADNITPFILAPAPSTVVGFEPAVDVVSTPSNRDVYRIGVGVDAIGLVCMWKTDWCN